MTSSPSYFDLVLFATYVTLKVCFVFTLDMTSRSLSLTVSLAQHKWLVRSTHWKSCHCDEQIASDLSHSLSHVVYGYSQKKILTNFSLYFLITDFDVDSSSFSDAVRSLMWVRKCSQDEKSFRGTRALDRQIIIEL